MSKVSRSQLLFLFVFIVGILGLIFYERIFNRLWPLPAARGIALISEVQGTPRIRRYDQLHWQDIQEGTWVHSGDYILTGYQTKLKINFEDSSMIELGDNSFVRVTSRKGKYTLEVKSGQLLSSSIQKQLEIKKMEGFKLPAEAPPATPSPTAKMAEASGPSPSPQVPVAQAETTPVPTPSEEDVKKALAAAKSQPVYSTSPKEGSVILFSRPGDLIRLTLNRKCIGDGVLEVTTASGQRREFPFTDQSSVQRDFKASDLGEGLTQWKFKDSGQEGRGEFSVFKFSSERISEALKQNKNVEVLQ